MSTFNKAKHDLEEKIGNDIEAHNTSEDAHITKFKKINDKIDSIITEIDGSDSQTLKKATSLSLVKGLLSKLSIKNADDVVKAIESKKNDLGITFDLSNSDSWYICLGKQYDNLLIQGGRKLGITIWDGKKYECTFPLKYPNKCISVFLTLEWGESVGGASVAYTTKRTTTGFTIVADSSNSVNTSDICYLAVGN